MANQTPDDTAAHRPRRGPDATGDATDMAPHAVPPDRDTPPRATGSAPARWGAAGRARRALLPLLFALALLPLAPLAARADTNPAAWLDDPAPANWNQPGAVVPSPTHPADAVGFADVCQPYLRDPETPADQQVAAAGWKLWGSYQSGWGVRIVEGTLSLDAQCRPFGLQAFVFVDGVFAGTLMPGAWAPRSDGTLADTHLVTNDQINARYLRYAQPFPLCCPTGEAFVTFDIVRGQDGPVVRPNAASNQTMPAS